MGNIHVYQQIYQSFILNLGRDLTDETEILNKQISVREEWFPLNAQCKLDAYLHIISSTNLMHSP